MTISEKDKSILRDLAVIQVEIASSPEQKEKAELWRRLNGLRRARPMVLIQNATWHETGDEIRLETQDEYARGLEWGFRAMLYQWERMRDDTLYQRELHCPIVVKDTGWGIETSATRPEHEFGAAHFNAVLTEHSDPSMIPLPTVTVDWEQTERNYQRMCEIFDGVIPVVKRGIAYHWFAIMDLFITWRGLDNMFTDMVDRPQWVHAWMDRMTQWHLSWLEQVERLNVLSLNNAEQTIGPGGFGTTDELPRKDFDGRHVRPIDQWGHATTQIFSLVSPEMHEEFALTYERKFLARFGLAGYGCCEPLDRKISILKTIPNLRRVSMSPWADVARGAEGLGNRYIFSYKPNPAILGMEGWDVDLARRQLRDVFEKTRGCLVEVIMKDLHTCRRQPNRMWEWTAMATDLAQEYS